MCCTDSTCRARRVLRDSYRGWRLTQEGAKRRRVRRMLASLVAALVSAFCYGIAAVMQAIAVRSASHRPAPDADGAQAAGRVDPGLVVRMLRQGPFVASLGIDLVGFLAQLVA